MGQFKVFGIAVAMCSALVLVLCLTFWLDAACLNEQRRVVMKTAGGVGCFEFWLNRYQSLLGNVLTAVVAGITLIWISRQFAAANQQTAAAASQTLRVRADELEAEKRGLMNDIGGNWHAIQNINTTEVYILNNILSSIRPSFIRSRSNVLELSAYCLSQRAKSLPNKRELKYLNLEEICAIAIEALDRLLANMPALHGRVEKGEDFDQAANAAVLGMEGVVSAREVVLFDINVELILTWKAVRRFERSATAISHL
ncbi:hypothetical protein LJR090_002535 [Bosea sp. LjRoot90]|uniref:hypothetical protein n=1 Tax=Bosea sp. LjRoot90 TaxID=3342342 RepID=UPI003ED053FE